MVNRKNLKSITAGERLWLWRRTNNLNQEQAGAMCGVTEKHYCAAENDRSSVAFVPKIPIGIGDLCALARRRAGLPMHEAAAMVGVSHVTLLAWEKCGEPRLKAAWGRRGYRF